MAGEPGDLLLFAADKNKIVWNVLGALRIDLAKKLDLIDNNKFNFLWVIEFPLMLWDEEQGRYVSAHHPFTAPVEEDMQYIKESIISNKNNLLRNKSTISSHFCGKTAIFKNENSIVLIYKDCYFIFAKENVLITVYRKD